MFRGHFQNNTENPFIGTLVITHDEDPNFRHYVDRINLVDVKETADAVEAAKQAFEETKRKTNEAETQVKALEDQLNA